MKTPNQALQRSRPESIGSTIADCSGRFGDARLSSSSRRTIGNVRLTPQRSDSHKTVSGNPGAVHISLVTPNSGSNQKGRLTQVADNSGSTSWTYDLQGRVVTKQQSMGIIKSVGYAYDTFGRLQTFTLPSGNTITYGYTNGRLTSLQTRHLIGRHAQTFRYRSGTPGRS
jgi:YD repeat-containing protein